MIITFNFKPQASFLGAIIGVVVSVILITIFPSFKQTWLLKPFWGGLCALGMISAIVSAFSAIIIFNNLSRWTTECAGVSSGYVISRWYLPHDFSLNGMIMGTIVYAFAAYIIYDLCLRAFREIPD